jgi:hypothetical protein
MPVDLVTRGGSGNVTVTTGIYTVVSVVYLKDSAGVTWALTVGLNGNLTTTVSSGAAFPFFVLEDSNGVFWKVFLTGTNGNLDTSNNGISALALTNLFLTDASGRNWYLTINAAGNLDTI